MSHATDEGRRVGRAIARDVKANGMPREWTGLDAQDGDELTSQGIVEGTDQWDEAVNAAREAYLAAIDD